MKKYLIKAEQWTKLCSPLTSMIRMRSTFILPFILIWKGLLRKRRKFFEHRNSVFQFSDGSLSFSFGNFGSIRKTTGRKMANWNGIEGLRANHSFRSQRICRIGEFFFLKINEGMYEVCDHRKWTSGNQNGYSGLIFISIRSFIVGAKIEKAV